MTTSTEETIWQVQHGVELSKDYLIEKLQELKNYEDLLTYPEALRVIRRSSILLEYIESQPHPAIRDAWYQHLAEQKAL